MACRKLQNKDQNLSQNSKGFDEIKEMLTTEQQGQTIRKVEIQSNG
jgi:hypothetical protein